jgi:hypothetical protein
MAVGFPTKTTYANGDVFSASDINDTNGTLNLVNPSTTGTVQGNPLLNSAMQVWQRGTSIVNAGTAFYAADRWCFNTNSTGRTISRQATNDTTNLPFIQYCMRVARDSGNTATTAIQFAQSMETINSIPFAGKTVTMSFYARAGANYSGTLAVYLIGGTGTDQNVFSSYTGTSYPVNNQTATLTTTWQRFTFTGSVGATVTEMTPYFSFTPSGTAGANDYLEITGVQIDIGSVALPFRTYSGTIQGELAACQRYYFRNTLFNNGTAGAGAAISTTAADINVQLPVTMRVVPTSLDTASLRLDDGVSAFTTGTYTLATSLSSTQVAKVQLTGTSGLTQYRPYFLSSAGGTSYVGFSAEL